MKAIKIKLHNGVNNVIVTDINDVVSYPSFAPIDVAGMVEAVKTLHPSAAVIRYIPDNIASNLIKQIDVYSPSVIGNEIDYLVYLGESGREDNIVTELVNFVNSI